MIVFQVEMEVTMSRTQTPTMNKRTKKIEMHVV